MIRIEIEFTREAADRTGVGTMARAYDEGAIGSLDKAVADLLGLALHNGLSQDDVLVLRAERDV